MLGISLGSVLLAGLTHIRQHLIPPRKIAGVMDNSELKVMLSDKVETEATHPTNEQAITKS